jgi:hypothetical protein
MRIDDNVFFSPEIPLKDLDIDDRVLMIDSFKSRIKQYYLRPIKILNSLKSAFAAGILEFSFIDALARYSTNSNRVGERIEEMIITISKTTNRIAERCYDEFRNGLLHESHIKNCGQFCYEYPSAFNLDSECLIINPLLLQRDLCNFFELYISELQKDDTKYDLFILRIRSDFGNEIKFFKALSEKFSSEN